MVTQCWKHSCDFYPISTGTGGMRSRHSLVHHAPVCWKHHWEVVLRLVLLSAREESILILPSKRVCKLGLRRSLHRICDESKGTSQWFHYQQIQSEVSPRDTSTGWFKQLLPKVVTALAISSASKYYHHDLDIFLCLPLMFKLISSEKKEYSVPRLYTFRKSCQINTEFSKGPQSKFFSPEENVILVEVLEEVRNISAWMTDEMWKILQY